MSGCMVPELLGEAHHAVFGRTVVGNSDDVVDRKSLTHLISWGYEKMMGLDLFHFLGGAILGW